MVMRCLPRQLLTPAAALLLGLAEVCRGISVLGGRSGAASTEAAGSAQPALPSPFDPAHDAVMIYSRGKTGTTSLQATIGLMMEPPCTVFEGFPENPTNFSATSVSIRATKCHASECALNFLSGRPKGSRTWVITSNRNPFTRYPSEMFQFIAKWKDEEIANVSMEKLLSFFHDGSGEKEYHVRGVPNVPRDWFRRYFSSDLGLDISAHPFDFDRRLLRFQHVRDSRTLEVLALRLEDSAQWEAILKPFFPKISLKVDNVASEKASALAAKYREFMSALRYTEEEIEYLSKSEDLAQFYTREEREAFVKSARDPSLRSSSRAGGAGSWSDDWEPFVPTSSDPLNAC